MTKKEKKLPSTSSTELKNRISYLEAIAAKYKQTEETLKKTRQDLHIRNKVLEAINNVADNIYRSLDYPSLAREAIAAMVEYGKTATATMFEYDEDENCLVMIDASLPAEKAYSRVLTQRLYLDKSAAGEALREKKIILCSDIASDPRILPATKEALLKEGRKSAVFIPLLFQDRVLGTINLVFPTKFSFKDYELETLLSIGKTIGLAMANVRYVGKIKDEIARREQTQEALVQSEEKYRLLIENAHEAIFIIQEGFITYANPRALNLLEFDLGELRQKPAASFLITEDKQRIPNKKTGGRSVDTAVNFKLINKNLTEYSLEVNIIDVLWENKKASLYFGRDVTGQKKMEAQLYQAQKMEAVGTLAGGLAHDFNNLLMGIQGNTSLILLQMPASHPYYERLKNIEQYVGSGAEITRQLLGFARGGKYELKAINIGNLIEKSAVMFGRTRKEISIHSQFQNNLWSVEVDRGQMEQVFLNLYVNAWQAMPGGGHLYLTATNTELTYDMAIIHGVKPGRYVKSSVTDDGIGMDEKTKSRLFDPFFTTKDRGLGIGLGLASAYGIIKNHGGAITVYSEKGRGTTFNIYLPASEKEADRENIKVEDSVISGKETILFVDDEEMIVNVGKDMLESIGYSVLTAKGGREAVEIYKLRQAEVNLVILDLIMPDFGGEATFESLREISPDVNILLSSGYSINGQATKLLERGCRGFIQKPYSIKELSTRIREILDRK